MPCFVTDAATCCILLTGSLMIFFAANYALQQVTIICANDRVLWQFVYRRHKRMNACFAKSTHGLSKRSMQDILNLAQSNPLLLSG